MNTGTGTDGERKARTLEDLFVYRKARELANSVYALTREACFARDFGLVDQIRRAAVSVMSNIAEGHERGSNQEYIQFLYIAKGSCGEVRAQLTIACDQGYITRTDLDRLTNLCRLVGGGLSNFIEYLRGTPLRGPKYAPVRNPAVEAFEQELRRYWVPPDERPPKDKGNS